MREAPEKSTSARVPSASARTVELVLSMSIPSGTLAPTSSPIETRRIAGVSGDPREPFRDAGYGDQSQRNDGQRHSIQNRSINP